MKISPKLCILCGYKFYKNPFRVFIFFSFARKSDHKTNASWEKLNQSFFYSHFMLQRILCILSTIKTATITLRLHVMRRKTSTTAITKYFLKCIWMYEYLFKKHKNDECIRDKVLFRYHDSSDSIFRSIFNFAKRLNLKKKKSYSFHKWKCVWNVEIYKYIWMVCHSSLIHLNQ